MICTTSLLSTCWQAPGVQCNTQLRDGSILDRSPREQHPNSETVTPAASEPDHNQNHTVTLKLSPLLGTRLLKPSSAVVLKGKAHSKAVLALRSTLASNTGYGFFQPNKHPQFWIYSAWICIQLLIESTCSTELARKRLIFQYLSKLILRSNLKKSSKERNQVELGLFVFFFWWNIYKKNAKLRVKQ